MEKLKNTQKKFKLFQLLTFASMLIVLFSGFWIELGKIGFWMVVAPLFILLLVFSYKSDRVGKEIFDIENPDWRPFQWVKSEPARVVKYKNKWFWILIVLLFISLAIIIAGQITDIAFIFYEIVMAAWIATGVSSIFHVLQLIDLYQEEVDKHEK